MTVSGRSAERIAAIARVQRGRVARRQLVAAGISPATVTRLVLRGQLLPLHRGVFAVGHLAPAEWGPETAALLAVREGAALSHGSAARLWDLSPAGFGDGVVHLVVSESKGAQLAGVLVHRTRILERRDVRVHLGLPVTSPASTLLDLAGVLTQRQLEFAFDQAVVSRIMRPSQMLEVLARSRGRHGHGALLKLAETERAPTLTRSEAEERFLALIRSAQLPEPQVNARIHGYEVDFLWREQRLVVEIDGYRYHSTRRAFEHDRRKDATLHAAGLGTMRITWRQLEAEPLAVVARLAAALG
jgi:very-short-patch-repair endonuclease